MCVCVCVYVCVCAHNMETVPACLSVSALHGQLSFSAAVKLKDLRVKSVWCIKLLRMQRTKVYLANDNTVCILIQSTVLVDKYINYV